MKIELFGNKALIASASASQAEVGLIMAINCNDKDLPFYRAGTSSSLVRKLLSELNEKLAKPVTQIPLDLIPKHDCIFVSDHTGATACEVVFIAENNAEEKLLEGFSYEKSGSSQITILKAIPSLCFNKLHIIGLTGYKPEEVLGIPSPPETQGAYAKPRQN